jgi:plastocyanin
MQSFFFRSAVIPAVVVGMITLAGDAMCEVPGNPTPKATTVDVSIVNFGYIPSIISIQPGDTVRWTNDGGVIPHTTTDGGPFAPTPGQIWDSGFLSGGDTFSFVFDSAGEFDYFCTFHPLLMFGEVFVGGTGIQVGVVPDDISPGALSTLGIG